MNTRSASRKRKQATTDSDDYNPTDDYQPPPKRQKTYHHVDTPHPQRRSTRIAMKQSINDQQKHNNNDDEDNNNAFMDYEQIENEEKDISQATSIHDTGIGTKRRSSRLKKKYHSSDNMEDENAFKDTTDIEENSDVSVVDHSSNKRRSVRLNGHSMNSNSNNAQNGNNTLLNGHNEHNGHHQHNTNGHNGRLIIRSSNSDANNDWNGRLRRSTRIKQHKYISTQSHLNEEEEDDDDNNVKNKRQDSDYAETDFQQDLQEEQEEEDLTDKNHAVTTDDMNDADENDHTYTNNPPRRRSQRLRKKQEELALLTEDSDIDKSPSKSNSLPLSLRRPRRNRKPPPKLYEQTQEMELLQRRQSLRTRKPVNYAESPDEDKANNANDTDSSDEDGVSVTTSASKSSRRSSYSSRRSRSSSKRGRRRNKRRRNGNKRGRKRGSRNRRRSVSYVSSSEEEGYTDSSESYSTDTFMDIREQKRIARERRKIKPIQIHDLGLYHEGMAPNLHHNKKEKASAADISPMEIDIKATWNMVGGLQHHVQKLKEMVVLPLLYPAEFAVFKMSTPKGVLFHGPPGTGKTLVARVLAAQCSIGTNADGTPRKKVSFYMRKGADCLSKWVGEAERQLRLLFDEAHKNQPAVIFFDEIDGLAPVRSSRQDQIHSSIVSTLLALMDGLDSRGQIIVIGATNRPDAIDPALRRPGRFDRELCFNLPTRKARKEILKIHTKSWDETNCKLEDKMLNYLSEQSVGYCGADLEALCREAFLAAVRRTYPQIYHSNVRLQIDTKKLQVIQEDFEKALKDITPSSQRSSLVYARALPDLIRPLLEQQLNNIKRDISGIFALRKEEYEDDDQVAVLQQPSTDDADIDTNHNNNNNSKDKRKLCSQHYRYLIHGDGGGYGQSYLGTAVLHLMEEYPMYSLDLASIMGDSTTKCAEESILRIFKEAQRNTPSVIYWPHIDRWWEAAHDILKTSITLLINDIAHDCPILIVATSNLSMEALEDDLQTIFVEKYAFHDCKQSITEQERRAFWNQLCESMKEKPRHKPKTIEEFPSLPIAELPKDSNNDNDQQQSKNEDQKTESERLIEQERMACVNLRVYIRSVCNRLCKHFKNFIDRTTEDGVVQNKLSLFDIRQRNNEREVPTVIDFLKDIDELVENVTNSAQTESLKARQFINEACQLQDQALSMMSQVNRELVKQCDKMAEKHKLGEKSGKKRRRVSFADDVDDEDTMNHNVSNGSMRNQSVLRNGGHHNHDKEEMEENDDVDDDGQNEDDANDVDMVVMNEDDDDEGHKVDIDENKMNAMMDRLVELTENYVVEEMEEKMYNLLRIIYQHSNEWNRNPMIEELDNHIGIYFKEKH